MHGIIDLKSADPGHIIDTDILVIGAGPAGMAIALELAGGARRVCMLDSGGVGDTPDDAGRTPLESTGTDYPIADSCRAFRLGGSTSLWGGHAIKLTPLEMAGRDWIPGSAWPIEYHALEPYYARAMGLLDMHGADFDAATVARALDAPLLPVGDGFESTVAHFNALDFAARYGEALATSPNIATLLNATATDLMLNDALDAIAGVTVKTAGGGTRTIHADTVVLAAGGIENARLLLASNGQMAAGVGNAHDLVGRNFMEHLCYFSGVLAPGRTQDFRAQYGHYAREVPFGGHKVRFHLAAGNDLASRLRIPQFRAQLLCMPLLRWAGGYLARGSWPRRETALSAAADLLRYPIGLAKAAAGKHTAPWSMRLLNNVEQVPNPESRITLSDRRDALDERLATLDWRLSAIDKEGILRAHEALAHAVRRSGAGHFHIEIPADPDDLLEGVTGANHHMGTTRMSDSPREGVVDADLKAHGIANLYIAGSSVFPSGGWANPTLTIIALSLRLADHLKARG